ncbi:hypothetical protein [Massilia genomosp. 1]|uniref:Uncharacterized protein n=1 Tax=Massilia genomosp. 1 TaxID=2609280 RepID=A0ABX0MS37_9BURK|nr:hypothetical protein [Massilia genomosp. 1]NHZ63400.1 hypothetical protein [Massilia genomosp. 1]
MKLELMQYTCSTGAHQFVAPEIVSGSYGDFLFRSEASKEMRFLNGIEDATYKTQGGAAAPCCVARR